MDVRCEQCETDFELDEARIPEAGARLVCTQCRHIFRARRKSVLVVLPDVLDGSSPMPLDVLSRPREWQVRLADGSIFTLRELTTLQRLIVEGKLQRDAEVGLNGGVWKRLGEIPDLAPFFTVLERAKAASFGLNAPESAPPPPLPTQAAPEPPTPPAARASSSSVSVVRFSRTDAAPLGKEPTTSPGSPSRGLQVSSPDPANIRPQPNRISMPPGAPAPEKGASFGIYLTVALLGVLGAAGLWAWRGKPPPNMKPDDPVVAAKDPDLQPGRSNPVDPPSLLHPPVAEDAEAAPPDNGGPSAPTRAPADTKVADPQPSTSQQSAKPPGKPGFDSFISQGDRYLAKERPAQAILAYNRAEELDPTRAEPVAGRGLALLDMGKTQPAIQSFQQALKLNPSYAVAVMGLAEAYRSVGQKADAVKSYQRYLELVPDGTEAEAARQAISDLTQ